MLHAKNACLRLSTGRMDYIRFGSGERVLVMLPGVGDGLKTVKGMALPFALLYRKLARDFTGYVFSRRRELPRHMTTREMAKDQDEAMAALGLSGAAVVGVSQGGMIAQWLAIDHGDKVRKLVLTVTLRRTWPGLGTIAASWWTRRSAPIPKSAGNRSGLYTSCLAASESPGASRAFWRRRSPAPPMTPMMN